ncbi:hypothetical protein EON82_00535 [bacterium]|nr:MAG: hypothetical protein EON82_00535 [bacterium]
MPKRVLLLVIDALTPRVFIPGIKDGRLPTFRALAERGALHPECCSIFPSITHACLSSIATGTYPIEHGVVGSFWYEEDNDDIAYYGAQFWMVLHQGIDKFLEDLVEKMNMERLKAPTVFERIEEAGRKAGSINHLIYRGALKYKVHEPLLVRLVPFLRAGRSLCGPSVMMLGDFVPLVCDEERVKIDGGATHKFGIEDGCTIAALKHLAEKEALPDFTLAYFPDNDVQSHEVGPQGAFTCLQTIDKGLGEIIEALGGLDKFLDEYTLLVHGDHAQSDVLPEEGGGPIELTELIEGVRILTPGKPLKHADEVIIAPNLRTAFLYLGEATPERRDRLTQQLLEDDRVDQVLWQADIFEPNAKGFCVATKTRGTIRFWNARDEEPLGTDDYGGRWIWEGDLSTLNAKLQDGKLVWGEYPNAFERIACGVGPKYAGHLWVTAKIGHSFKVPHTGAHPGGGSHASLHRYDSFTALLAAGLPEGVELPERPRIVDTAHLVLRILGIPGDELGKAHFENKTPQHP